MNGVKVSNTRSVCRRSPVRNERGVALIVALIVLVLLGILGAFALSTSNTELRISGNYRNLQQAFYAADAAISYGESNTAIYASIIPGTTNSWPPTATDYNDVPDLATGQSAKVRVDYLLSGPLPPGTGFDAETFQANYYTVSASGFGQLNSEVDVESRVGRIVPKPGY